MNGFVLVLSAALPSFLLGYALRRFILKWQTKANAAKLQADIQAEQMTATISASLDGIIIINSEGCIVEFSESAERIFGYNKEEILGQNMAAFIVPERYRDAHNAGMERMRETGKANILGQRIEIEAVRANGEEFMSELAISRSRSSSGDIFIAYIVLDYARISSGSVKVRDEPFFAADVFDDVYRLFAMQAKERGIDLAIRSKDTSKIHLSGDEGRIRQILMNFVSNAIKHTDNGKVELIVDTIQMDSEKWILMCRVKDTGVGIKSDKLERLFDEFYMVDDIDTRSSEGAGLGLTICKVLVKMMNGEIGVESEFGQGSDFWIKIPLAQASAPVVSKVVEGPMADISGKKILLAEDNATNRMVVTRILKKHEAKTVEAVNGVEALSILEMQAFDLLLTDIFMPEMGGKELVRLLRKGGSVNAKIPVIALTAMGDMHEAEDLKSYGVDQVVLKPFNTRNLINAVAVQCKRHQKRQSFEKSDNPEVPAMKISGGLLDGLDPEDLIEIKGQFEIDLTDVTASLRRAIASQDWEAAKFASHTLKGLAGLYGLAEISEFAALTYSHCFPDTLEEMVKHGSRAIELAQISLLNLGELFGYNEEAA